MLWKTCLLLIVLSRAALAGSTLTGTGMCDASAGVALNSELIAAASDEDNVLRVYRAESLGAPVSTVALSTFLETPDETDIEGAALIGSRVYWTTSHGRNKSGKPRPARHRFFATTVSGETLVPVGKPCKDLIRTMIAEPKLARFDLVTAETKAPEAPGGLNVEGLAATPDGGLLVAFRNPIPQGKALIVPVTNPAAIVERGATPALGDAVLLDLGGRGIRSIDWLPERREYLLVAGPPADSGSFDLFRWSGKPGEAPVRVEVPGLARLHPEALIPVAGRLLVLSDDGGVSVNGVACKDLPRPEDRSFRALWLTP